MDNIGLILYFWSIAEKLNSTLGFIAVMGLIIGGIGSFVGFIGLSLTSNSKDYKQFIHNFLKKYIPFKTYIFLCLLWVFLPTQKDIAIIAAGSIGASTIQNSLNDEHSKLNKISKILDAKLDEALESMQSTNKKEK